MLARVSVLSVCIWIAIGTVLSTFRTDQLRFSQNNAWAISTDKILHTNEMLTCTNDLIRLKTLISRAPVTR